MTSGCRWPVKANEKRLELGLRVINTAQIINKVIDSGFEFNNIKIVKKNIKGNAVEYAHVISFFAT